jgi:hypothetical protein
MQTAKRSGAHLRLAEAMKHLSIPHSSPNIPQWMGDTLPTLKAIVTTRHLSPHLRENQFLMLRRRRILECGLDERPQIVLCGIETHICVLSTTMELLERGFDVAVTADATGSRNPEHHQLALDAMRQCGALVVPVETIVYQLVGKSGTDLFKRILPLFK